MRRNGLPRGYSFDYSSVQPAELYSLFRDVETFNDKTEEILMEADWEDTLADSLVNVGVRNRGHSLVGFGVLLGNKHHATLDELAVHPEHRHQGIGRSLVTERVGIAKDIGVRVLDTYLMRSNTLEPLYLQLGFKLVGHMHVKRF